MLLTILQEPAGPPLLPWWVLYVVLLAITWATWRTTKSRWWKGCLTVVLGWVFVFFFAAVTLPTNLPWLILLVTLAPTAGFFAALAGRRRPDGAGAFALPRRFTLSGETMRGQPSPRSVLKSKMMASRFAAGMPRDVSYVARLAYVSGLEEGTDAKPVDLFLGGGRLWVAPLKPGATPVAIALHDMLRVDVWPEGDAPPTLRVSWSPPAGELTRELVLAAIPEVPPPLVGRQLGAIAGAVTDAMQHDEKAALEARRVSAPVAVVAAEICPRCGTAYAEGARRCAMCGLEKPHR